MKKTLLASLLALTSATALADPDQDAALRLIYNMGVRYTNAVEFPQIISGNAVLGQAQFGLAPDGVTIDTSQALFQGTSVIYGPLVSNGTACATCHRPANHFMLPQPPMSTSVPAGDPLLTGRNAEGQGDPRWPSIFENLGLVKQRPGRFNPLLSESSPFRKVFSWRKTQTVENSMLTYGLLTDARARGPVEQARGAAFTHTQDTDVRFDDLANPALPNIVAFQETVFNPPELINFLNPSSPEYPHLVNEPFYTVHATTAQQLKGQDVFQRQCMGCHNVPNLFSNRDHVNGPPPNFPPLYGHLFDVGVGERNALNLDYRWFNPTTGGFETIILPLAREDGTLINWTVTDDVGAAAGTGRYEDLHRFKVPHLRGLASHAPYFHDGSAKSIDAVVDFFNSDAYNDSVDGRNFPVHLSGEERDALIAFLNIL